MRRAYKFRIYPTTGQVSRAAQCLRDHQRLYNAALEERREAWRMRKVSIRYGQQSAQLKDIRAYDPDQGRWSFSSQQATLRRLDKAMTAFYRRCKAGQKAGYPRFRALDRWDSVEWPSDRDGCRWKPGVARVYCRLQAAGESRPPRSSFRVMQTVRVWWSAGIAGFLVSLIHETNHCRPAR